MKKKVEPRSKLLSVRLTESEKKLFIEQAEKNGIGISKWAHWLLKKYKKEYGKPKPSEKLTELTNRTKTYIESIMQIINEIDIQGEETSDFYDNIIILKVRLMDINDGLDNIIEGLKFETALERLKRNLDQSRDSSSKRRNRSE